MSEHKFRKFEIEHGIYYLVPKAELDAILGLASTGNKIHIVHKEAPTFGQILRIFRQSQHLTYEDLSRETHVSLRTLKDQETRGTKPQRASLDKLCDFFGTEFENQLPADLKQLRGNKTA